MRPPIGEAINSGNIDEKVNIPTQLDELVSVNSNHPLATITVHKAAPEKTFASQVNI
jgi:hypothetical protein